jgi:hypothetical protein
MYEYLLDNGMTREEYRFFLTNRLRRWCVMGNDYYITNEHLVSANGRTREAGEVFGYATITRQYYERYKLPVMHTETNLKEGATGHESTYWLWKQWANVLRVRNDGVPMLGFTWYSLVDQVDWDSALREPRGRVNPRGLYDLDRRIRPVGKAYRELIGEWRAVLPTQSVVLSLPAFPPSRQDDPLVRDLTRQARHQHGETPRTEPGDGEPRPGGAHGPTGETGEAEREAAPPPHPLPAAQTPGGGDGGTTGGDA